MTFKEKLVILRKTKHLTQDEFASAVGVSRQAVYKWESGQSYPEVPKLLEMKLLFGISIDELLDDTYDIPLPEKKRKKKITKEAKLEIEKSISESIKKSAPAPKATPAPKAAPAPKATPAPKAAPAAPKVTFEAAPAPKVAEVPKAQPVFTPVAPKAEEYTPVIKETPVFTPIDAVSQEPEQPVFTPISRNTEVEDKEEKKSGFFGRLFNRK